MATTYTGIDIGTSDLKLAVCSGGAIKRMAVERMPDNLVRDGAVVSPEAMSSFLREAAKKHRMPTGACAVSLPASAAFFRRMTMPAMSVEHLRLNLPYEFRDYITQEKDKYFYDYAVAGVKQDEQGNPTELDLMAAATPKSTIRDYTDMLRRAGFKLRIAVPQEFAYCSVVREYERRMPSETEREYCIIDLGHTATRVHILTGSNHETTRIIEYGGSMLDAAIAEACNVDEHVACTYKLANHNNVLELDACRSVCSAIAVEIMRAINFYRFNNPNSLLTEAYFCGGGTKIAPLTAAISAAVDLKMHGINELLPPTEDGEDELGLCAVAFGVTQQ